MKKITALLAAAVFLIGGSASAYDLAALTEKSLSKTYSYQAIPSTETLSFAGGTISYRMGQLTKLMPRVKKFSSGYIIEAQLPQSAAEAMKPFFRLNPGEEQWEKLIKLNRIFMDPDSFMRKDMQKTMMSLAVNAMGPLAEKNVTVEISGLEPFRRMSADEAYVFTAGAHITFNAQGLILPMYSRAYFFPSSEGKNLDVLMLFTPDEGKGPLVYAIDDLAKEAAKSELLGSAGYKDLGELLAQKG
jgi:hypothetical protein